MPSPAFLVISKGESPVETKRKAVPLGVKQLVPSCLLGMAGLKGPPPFFCSAPRLLWALLPSIWAYGTSIQLIAQS